MFGTRIGTGEMWSNQVRKDVTQRKEDGGGGGASVQKDSQFLTSVAWLLLLGKQRGECSRVVKT